MAAAAILNFGKMSIAFALSLFARSKRITEGCSLWDDFNGNVAISNVYK